MSGGKYAIDLQHVHGNAVIQPQRVVTATVRIDHKKTYGTDRA